MRSAGQVLINFLLNASWQIALLTIGAACCHRLLRGMATTYRHALWVAAIVLSFLVPLISGFNVAGWANAAAPVVDQVVAVNTGKSAFSEVEEHSAAPLKAVEMPPAPAAVPKSSPIALNQTVALSLLAAYLLFITYRAFKLLRAWRKTKGIVSAAQATEPDGLALEVIGRCQAALGVSRVRIVSSPTVLVPVTAGIFRPSIILPENLLRSPDTELLTTAIGHELAHVARRDYLLNLAYEIIYLPMAFHPAAAFLRRRIRQTRELCCDELVANKLLGAELYARSLVRLIGDAALAPRLASDVTIGIGDADILEVRIMSLLKNSKTGPRRNALVVLAAGLMLALPCAAALGFAVQFDITKAQDGGASVQEQTEAAKQRIERAREEIQRKQKELAEHGRKLSGATAGELEALRHMEAELGEATMELRSEKDAERFGEMKIRFGQMKERYAELATHYPDSAAMREAQQKLEELGRSLPDEERMAREFEAKFAAIEKEYPKQAISTEKLKALAAAQEEFERNQEKFEREHEKFEQEREQFEQEQERASADYDANAKVWSKEQEQLIRKGLDKEIHKGMLEASRVFRPQEQYELSRLATVSMDRAIQIATSQQPGKVVSASLGRQKNGQLSYRFIIINDEGGKNSVTRVWVSATDGSVIKKERE